MHKLPAEILVMVCGDVVRHATRSRDRCISLFRLMLVCRWWRDIILGNVTFWSHISASDEESIPFALKSIDRSGGSQLTVSLTAHSSVTNERMATPLSKIADQSGRLAKFSIIVPSFHILPQWTSPAANLHTLVLRNKGTQQPLAETASFADLPDLLAASPGLRSLNIVGYMGKPHPHLPPQSYRASLPHFPRCLQVFLPRHTKSRLTVKQCRSSLNRVRECHG